MLRVSWIAQNEDDAQGYGKVGHYLAHFVQQAGVELVPLRNFGWDLRVSVGGPRAWLLGRGDAVVPDMVYHTMFEARPLPSDWAPVLNRCRALWVPAEWNREIFVESGVTRPIYVGGYGVLAEEFQPFEIERQPDQAFTFLWAGTSLGDGRALGDRKGGDLVIQAFRKLNLPDARLILKVGEASHIKTVNGDPRIMLIAERMTVQDYSVLLNVADAFVYPSHGEGFGLQPLEAMACGLPVIAPAYSGMAAFVSDEYALPLPVHGEERANLYERIYSHECYWAALSVDDVADRMLWCYEHRSEARALGAKAAEHVLSDWTWEKAGGHGHEILEGILKET